MISFLTGYVKIMKADKKAGYSGSITKAEALNCKPIKNSGIKEKRLETGEILLAYPIAYALGSPP